MELLKVTKDIAVRAILFGACSIPKVGQLISEFSMSDLIWAEKMFSLKELKRFVRPIWTLSGNGNGDGYGYGNGDGDGYGNGYGYGHGNGNGDGNGNGNGNGNGDGYGNGNGYGYGYGDRRDIGAKILALDPQRGG